MKLLDIDYVFPTRNGAVRSMYSGNLPSLNTRVVRLSVPSYIARGAHTQHAQVTLICPASCHSVRPPASSLRALSSRWLLRKRRWSITLLLLTSLSLRTVNYFVKPACAGASHGRHDTARSITSAPNLSYQTRTQIYRYRLLGSYLI
jgi:hypothetical protein